MLLLFSIAALWVCVSSNCRLPGKTVGWHSPDIVYKIGDISKTNYTEQHVKYSFRQIEENTCINFIESKDAPERKLDFTIANGQNIYSCRYANGIIELGSCLTSTYTIQHETVHFLGLYHTNNRPEWRQYLKALPGKTINYDIDCPVVPVVGYDLGSGMHHNVEEEAVPIDEAYASTVGQAVRFPFSDYHSLNWLFNCSGGCTTQPNCKNGGYTHPRDCKKCMCNKYYTGDLCETPRNLTKLSCETKRQHSWAIDVMGDSTLKSKRILSDDFKYRGDDFWQIIEAPQNMKIQVEVFSQAGLYNPYGVVCGSSAVEINDGDFSLVGRMFCDNPKLARITHNFTARSSVVGLHVEYPKETWTEMSAKFTLLGCDAPLPPTTTTNAPTTTTTLKPTTTTTGSPTTTTTKPSITTTTSVKPDECEY